MSNILTPDENFLDSEEELYSQPYDEFNEYENSFDNDFDNGYNFEEWN
jgi:hypothetical protein